MDAWNNYSKRLIKSEMLKRNVSVDDLVFLLKRIGVKETKSSINSKVSRGTFSAAFLFQVLQVIECKQIEIIPPNDLSLKAALMKNSNLSIFDNKK
jgi:hypothetical protein